MRNLAQVVGGQRPDPQIPARGSLGDFYIANAVGPAYRQMHSSFPAKHFNRVPKFFADAMDEGAPALAVENPHSSAQV